MHFSHVTASNCVQVNTNCGSKQVEEDRVDEGLGFVRESSLDCH